MHGPRGIGLSTVAFRIAASDGALKPPMRQGFSYPGRSHPPPLKSRRPAATAEVRCNRRKFSRADRSPTGAALPPVHSVPDDQQNSSAGTRESSAFYKRRNGPEALHNSGQVLQDIINFVLGIIAAQAEANGSVGRSERYAHGADHMRRL